SGVFLGWIHVRWIHALLHLLLPPSGTLLVSLAWPALSPFFCEGWELSKNLRQSALIRGGSCPQIGSRSRRSRTASTTNADAMANPIHSPGLANNSARPGCMSASIDVRPSGVTGSGPPVMRLSNSRPKNEVL